ncbi:MAG: hypothetical protein HY075_16560 [Deltaproteobacteria bacterium]|nr:hypothetical protein [Deltaproteobacteria bacterium]
MNAILFALAAVFVTSVPAHAYYGRHSTEAVLTYHADADVALGGRATVEQLNEAGPARQKALALIHEQVRHLMGTFQAESFKRDFGYPGALGESYQIRFTDAQPGSSRGRALLSYDFRGTVVFQKESFHGRDERYVPLKLPLAPDLIYPLGLVKSHGREKNLCTDREYNDADDFWYYWDPDMDGCPLSGNYTDVIHPRGKLVRLPNTQLSYPEYDRLYGDNGNGKNVDIAVFLGFIEDQNVDGKRPKRGDEALTAFKYIENDLKERGYELTEKKNRFRVDEKGNESDGINFLRRYEADVGEVHVRVLVILADTDHESTDATFRHYFVRLASSSDILVYDGHSGLGENFDLGKMPGLWLDPNKYQIMLFNGCSTYPYVNGQYFRAKGGTRNLEIVTAGLPEFASTSGPNVVTFLDPFLKAKTLSYQKILSDMEISNGDEGTYLVGVKGDEDNEWTPNGLAGVEL